MKRLLTFMIKLSNQMYFITSYLISCICLPDKDSPLEYMLSTIHTCTAAANYCNSAGETSSIQLNLSGIDALSWVANGLTCLVLARLVAVESEQELTRHSTC